MRSWHLTALAWLLAALLVAIAAGALVLRGKRLAQFDNVQAQLRTTETSAGISRETADTMAAEQAETWRYAQADEGMIRERIEAQPRAAGPADADILRVAREAHARALCAASRVQREGCGDDATGTARQ